MLPNFCQKNYFNFEVFAIFGGLSYSADCHSADCHSADCYSADCRSADCRRGINDSADCRSADCRRTVHLPYELFSKYFHLESSLTQTQ